MSTHRLRPFCHLFLATAPVLAGVLLAACGSDPQASPATSTATVTGGSTETSTSTSATTVVDTTIAETTTTAKPKPKPGATTTTSTSTPMTLHIPPVTLNLGPMVTSASAKLSWTCAEANQAQHSAPVTWASTGKTVELSYIMPGQTGAYPAQPANGTHGVTIVCGLTTTVRILPIAADGTQGAVRKLIITVGS